MYGYIWVHITCNMLASVDVRRHAEDACMPLGSSPTLRSPSDVVLTTAASRHVRCRAPPAQTGAPHSCTTSGSTFQMPSAYSLMHRSLLKKPMRATAVMHLATHSSWLRYASSTSRCVSM